MGRVTVVDTGRFGYERRGTASDLTHVAHGRRSMRSSTTQINDGPPNFGCSACEGNSPIECKSCTSVVSGSPDTVPVTTRSGGAHARAAPNSKAKASGRTASRDPYDADDEARWKNLSRGLQGLRQLGLGYVANETLAHAARESAATPFAPLYALWAFDNYRMAGMYSDAVAAAAAFTKKYPDRDLHGQSLLGHILSCKADCERLLGDANGAVRSARELIRLEQRRGEDKPNSWYQLGRINLEFGRRDEARSAFLEAARCRSDGGVEHLRDRAKRDARRLEVPPRNTRSTPELVAKDIMRALAKRDEDALSELASTTHFSFGGLGGHTHFADPKRVLPHLMRDLRSSKTIWGRPEALEGREGKRYLMTGGWAGRTFLLQTAFQIVRMHDGWEWGGLVYGFGTEEAQKLNRQICGPGSPMENQPLAEPIKAPWPAPLAFQAGGAVAGIALEAAEAASLVTALTGVGVGCAGACAAALAGYPICLGICLGIGLPVAAALNTAQFAGIRALRGDRPCGWGVGGWYYNQNNHIRGPLEQQFAIDFTRWEPSNGFAANLSAGTPVLACHQGVVLNRLNDMDPRGSDGPGNELGHSFASSWLEDSVGTRYNARYLHLDGPSRLLVSIGQWVEQGFVLGFMDDTGFSAWDHLHFQVHDRTLPSDPSGGSDPLGRTTRPTPMDGPAGPQPLEGDGSSVPTNDGDCIVSDNVIANPRALCLLMAREAPDPRERARLQLACAITRPRDPEGPIVFADVSPDAPGLDDAAPRPSVPADPRPGFRP